MAKTAGLGEVTNDAARHIEGTVPYTADVTITGTSDIIFHRWSCEARAAEARKGSKKTDDLETYVYRDDDGFICLPGEYLRQSVINAAKYRKDPRSPRKSAMDLYKAGVVNLTALASLGLKGWQYEHGARVTVQRAGITRVRPAFKAGWSVEVQLMVLLPEYIAPMTLHEAITDAGRLVGVADYRPTFGRFGITGFKVS